MHDSLEEEKKKKLWKGKVIWWVNWSIASSSPSASLFLFCANQGVHFLIFIPCSAAHCTGASRGGGKAGRGCCCSRGGEEEG